MSGITCPANDSSGTAQDSFQSCTAPMHRVPVLYHSGLIRPSATFSLPFTYLSVQSHFPLPSMLHWCFLKYFFFARAISGLRSHQRRCLHRFPPLPVFFRQAQSSSNSSPALSGASRPPILLPSQPSPTKAPTPSSSPTKTLTTTTNVSFPSAQRMP